MKCAFTQEEFTTSSPEQRQAKLKAAGFATAKIREGFFFQICTGLDPSVPVTIEVDGANVIFSNS